jgi:hypothetical protein
MDPGVRIRGVYTTALTKIFLDEGFGIVDPSPEIITRFGLKVEEEPSTFLNIRDLRSRQGVYLEGDGSLVERALGILRERLFDLIIRKGGSVCKVEFPYLSKRYLDEIRGKVTTTIKDHHRLRVIAGDKVSRVESGEEEIDIEDLLYGGYKMGKEITIEHVKVDGRKIHLSPGLMWEFDPEKKSLKILRRFRGGGVYDGLGGRVEEGDFCVTLAREGSFCLLHSYYGKDKTPKGRLYSFNTPIEFYPSMIRYVDLELDVVESEGKKRMIDVEEFDQIIQRGFITERLGEKIRELAGKVMKG